MIRKIQIRKAITTLKTHILRDSVWFYLFLFVCILFLTQHRQNRITNFDCEICADKAGYYIYLAATFHSGFQASNYPEGFEKEHGDGFVLDRVENKVITKYMAGVAFLLAPFYFLGVMIESIFSLSVHPFSKYYMFFVNMGAAFYAVMGLFFLKKWFENYISRGSSILAILIIFFGTNLYYYTLDESLMSHLYSFSMFSIVLFSLKEFQKSLNFKYFILFSLALSIAILIRPTNALFGFIAFLFLIRKESGILQTLSLIFQPKNIIVGFLILFLIMLPQMIYWNFAYGSYLTWSYQGEGFIYWNSPWFLTVWFAPQSGLFLYTPVLIIPLIYAFINWKRNLPVFPLVIGTFLITSYMCAAWSNPWFGGCNFGKRPMVEYLPALMLPLGFLLEEFKNYPRAVRWFTGTAIFLSVLYNQLLFKAFNTCFFGDTWDWNKFAELLYKAVTFS